MKWTVTLSGSKEEARAAAAAQADINIAAGYQSESQKAAMLALIDVLVGPNVSGSISAPADGSTSDALVSTAISVDAEPKHPPANRKQSGE